MRHLKHRHQLGRKKEHRSALMANLAAALLTHGKIKTTLPKAKALRPFVEKIITLAKKAQTAPERSLAFRRLAIARVRNNDAVAILFNKRVGEFADRTGGYTRIYKLGTRTGDAAEMAVIQLIAASDEGYAKKGRSTRKTGTKSAEATVEAPEAEAVAPAPEEAVADNAVVEETGGEKKES